MDAIRDGKYNKRLLSDDLTGILSDIRETHRQDAAAADGESAAEAVMGYLQTAVKYGGQPAGGAGRVHLACQASRRGKSNPHQFHGKGKRKR